MLRLYAQELSPWASVNEPVPGNTKATQKQHKSNTKGKTERQQKNYENKRANTKEQTQVAKQKGNTKRENQRATQMAKHRVTHMEKTMTTPRAKQRAS